MVGETELVSPFRVQWGAGSILRKRLSRGYNRPPRAWTVLGEWRVTPHNGGDTATHGLVTDVNGGVTEKNERGTAGPREKLSHCTA